MLASIACCIAMSSSISIPKAIANLASSPKSMSRFRFFPVSLVDWASTKAICFCSSSCRLLAIAFCNKVLSASIKLCSLAWSSTSLTERFLAICISRSCCCSASFLVLSNIPWSFASSSCSDNDMAFSRAALSVASFWPMSICLKNWLRSLFSNSFLERARASSRAFASFVCLSLCRFWESAIPRSSTFPGVTVNTGKSAGLTKEL
mmetsp:Transcript_16901/g.34215  ORF Transcript_16901/g.34215 Transcript_16901/m.34215 type:complete len:206 (-) Transcript_16901:1376-1993(-)